MTKHNSQKRDKRIVIPVTQEERDYIAKVAQNTYYKTTANFCRESVFQICEALEQLDQIPDMIFELSTTPFNED